MSKRCELLYVLPPQRIRLSNLLWIWSLLLWVLPLIAAVIAPIFLEIYVESDIRTFIRSEFDYEQPGRYRSLEVDFAVLPFLLIGLWTTISYAIWSQMLRTCRIRHAITYAISAWIIARVIWWLPQYALDSPLTHIYADRTPIFGSDAGIVTTAVLAAIAVAGAIYAAYTDKPAIMRWALLALAAPFIAMTIAVTNSSDTTGWLLLAMYGDTCLFAILGVAILTRSITLKTEQPQSATSHSSIADRENDPENPDRRRTLADRTVGLTGHLLKPVAATTQPSPPRSQQIPIPLRPLLTMTAITVAAILTVGLGRVFGLLGQQDRNDWTVITDWIAMSALVAIVFLLARRHLKDTRQAISWAAVASFLLIAALLYYSDPFIRFPSNQTFYVYSIERFISFASTISIPGMIFLIASLYEPRFELLQRALPLASGMAWTIVFLLALAKLAIVQPPDQLQAIRWAELTLILIVGAAVVLSSYQLNSSSAPQRTDQHPS